MAHDEAVRWVPVEGLPELPLGAFDLTYTASENRLTVRACFRDISNWFPQFEPPAEGVIVEFEGVLAFKAYQEFNDPHYAGNLELPQLAEKLPYGGTWGFIQMLASSWLERLANRNGAWEACSASHWIVKTGDMVLHVATDLTAQPVFKGWIARSS